MRGRGRKEVQQTTWNAERWPGDRGGHSIELRKVWTKNAKRRSAAADGGNDAAAPKRLRAIRFRRLRRLRATPVLGAIPRPPASEEHSQASVASAAAAATFQEGKPKALWQLLCRP